MRRPTAGGKACVILVCAASLGGSLAWATETSTAQTGLQAATAALQPPRAVTAAAQCPNSRFGHVLVSWTASPSAFASGYVVTRATGTGAAAVVATLGATATSYDDTTVTGGTTYTYGVAATYLGWSSPEAAATVTTSRPC